MPAILLFGVVGFLIAPPTVGAQAAPATGPLRATARRLPSGAAIRLDGRLDEQVWRTGLPLTEFVQKEPNEGAPPTERMEVRFVYDDGALFVGARMYSRTRAAGIQAPLGRRDEVEQAEYVLVALDTYLDRRTAYCFGVTASGRPPRSLSFKRFRVECRCRVRSGLAGANPDRRRGMDRGTVDSVFAASFQRIARTDVGTEHPSPDADAKRGRLLGGHPADRTRLGLALW